MDQPSLPWSVLLRDPSVVVGVPMMLEMWAVAWLDREARQERPRARSLAGVLAVVGGGLALGAVALGAVPLDVWLGRSRGRTQAADLFTVLPDALGCLVASDADKPAAAFFLSYGWPAAWLGAYALLVVAIGLRAFLILRAQRTPPPAT
jgi:hypothetical protein